MSRPVRMFSNPGTNAVDGDVTWSPVRSLWFTFMAVTALVGCPLTASWSAFGLAAILTSLTLCCGHSVGMHRLMIHRSFECPRWVEQLLVFLGVLVGMGGPRRMMFMHESRDWAQNQTACHPFYNHRSGIFKDGLWNLHCECRLHHAPEFRPEVEFNESLTWRLLDRCWMAVQIPLAIVLYLAGGWAWVVWGICGRVTVSLIGHWFVGFLAHNVGQQTWRIEGAAVQGFNLPGLGMLTMGEAWHNNHHAYPDSARLGIRADQWDPGWWFILGLTKLGLAWNATEPHHIPQRKSLLTVSRASCDTCGSAETADRLRLPQETRTATMSGERRRDCHR